MLIGIVVTNAIVLLDLVERLRAEGVPLKEELRGRDRPPKVATGEHIPSLVENALDLV